MAKSSTGAKKASTSVAKARAEAAKARAEAARAKAEAAKERAAKLGGGHAAGFMNFIREQGVIGLAVGLAVGAAAGATVKQLVEGLINPIITLIVGSQEGLMAAKWHVEIGERSADFLWGAVLSSLITLVATALVVYWVIHLAKLDRLDKKKS